MSGLAKFLIILGILLVVIGLLLPVLQRLGFGSLPGDILIKKKNFTFYFPIVTSLIISIIISLILWLLRR